MLSALIIDDEVHCAETLQLLLNKYCPQINLLAVVNDPLQAEETIRKHKPQILFLDIEMPHLNGFDILNQVQDLKPTVVFTTAYDHYALQAIKHHALDYLLKPIDSDELIATIRKASDQQKAGQNPLSNIENLLKEIRQEKKIQKLPIPSLDGIAYIDTDKIIRISADSNYSQIYLENGKKLTSSRTLKEYEQILQESSFFRVHSAHLVNLKYVDRYLRGEGGNLVMSDGMVIEISRQKKKALLERLGDAK
jgi:two-component system LytT family response regulator